MTTHDRMDACGWCTLRTFAGITVRSIQAGCPEHSGRDSTAPRRVRTQAERDADGQAWRAVPRRTVVCQYDAKPHPLDDECVNVADAPTVPPRRRWWHRLTRRGL